MGNHPTETRSRRNLVLMTAANLFLGFLSLITGPRLQAQSSPLRPGTNGVGYPTCVYCPSPQYTDAALKVKFRGTVVLQVIIQPGGYATNIEVVKNPGFGLDAKAIDAVKTWRFKPALGPDRSAVATTTSIEVSFQPPDPKATSK
jgi:TonB family protein